MLSTHGRRSTSMQASAVMMHRKLAAVLAAVLFAGSASTGLAQGTRGARAPSPGIGGGGTGFAAPSPGIGTGGMAPSLTPTPGIGTGSPTNITPTPGIGTTPIPQHTYRRAFERGASGRRDSERKGSERRACERRAAPHPRGHQGGNRGRSHLPAMSSQRQISERATDVPWSSGISLLSTVPPAETALVPPGRKASGYLQEEQTCAVKPK